MNTEHSTRAGWRNLLLVLGLLAALARAQVTNPLNVNLSEDTDQDGISNADEVALGLDPYNPYNGISALDGAAFIVAWESYLGASSSTVDTDGDGWSDFDEVMVYQTNLFDERSLPGPISNLSAATTSQSVAASTPTATPSTSLIKNGDFSKTNISTWIDGKKLKGYNGSGFEWAAGSVEGWSAYAGSTIEVWNTGTRVVELNGDKSNYGIQQKVETAKPGAYLLTWQSLGRTQEAAPAKNKKTPPAPNNFYFVQVQIGEGSGGRAIKTENFTAGGDGVLVFQLSEKDLTDANGKGIYIAFIPTISSNSYGSLISGVNLVLVEVVVRKKTEAAAPETGLLVKKGDVITFDVNGPAPAGEFPFPPESVKWKVRQLKHDGTTTEWADVQGQGAELDFTTDQGGVFEAKAVVTPPGGKASDYPLTRKKDAPHSSDRNGAGQVIHKVGAIDYFGVVDHQWQIDLRGKALADLGSDKYKTNGVFNAPWFPYRTYQKTVNKCNIFVYHKCLEAGLEVPLVRGVLLRDPPLAIDWWNDNSLGKKDMSGNIITTIDIPNWSRLPDDAMPQPGLVVGRPVLGGVAEQYNAHVGIFDYDGSWISAGASEVNKYYHTKTLLFQPQGMRKYNEGN